MDFDFALKPLNVMTWPDLARNYLVVVTQYRHCSSVNSADTAKWLRSQPKGLALPTCMDIMAVLCAHSLVSPFLEPVNASEVAGYSKVVTRPMDLSAVRRRLYNYEHHSSFAEDVRLIWHNCLAFNDPGSFLSRGRAMGPSGPGAGDGHGRDDGSTDFCERDSTHILHVRQPCDHDGQLLPLT